MVVQHSKKERRFHELYCGAIAGWEKEKENLSKELHDGVCQDFAHVKIDLENIFSKIKENQSDMNVSVSRELNPHFERTIRDLRKSIGKLRMFMGNLSYFPMPDSGLINALKSYLRGVSGRHEMKINFHAQKNIIKLEKEQEIAFFRIVQEAVQNIVKHAKAKNVWIDISKIKNRLILAVKDDGKGFLPRQKMTKGGANNYGLFYMQERCAFLEGKFAITSQRGKGTKILISIPLEE